MRVYEGLEHLSVPNNNMLLHQIIPPPSFSPPLHPSPIVHPFSSPLAHPIPQTNQFSCLPSILLSMPAPTLSFVLCRDLHFQQPRINLSFMPPSITAPPITPSPQPTSAFKECRPPASPLNKCDNCSCLWLDQVWWGLARVSIVSRLGKVEVFKMKMREWTPPPNHPSPPPLHVRWHLL